MAPVPSTIERIVTLGQEVGLTSCGIASCDPSSRGDQLENWLARGGHAGMAWMERTKEVRKDLRRRWAWAKSALVATQSYLLPPRDRRALPGLGPYIARYARGVDYHDRMRDHLAAWCDAVETELGRPFRRALNCDTSALLERELAVRAGLGWIGRNNCLIGPEGDSWRFIGVALTDLELPSSGVALTERCGSCRACLDACPTQAIPEPFFVDAGRCISYLTIEHRGAIPLPLRDQIGDWLFGCDVCQEVCPWNQRAAPSGDPYYALRDELAETTLADVAALDVPTFRRTFRQTPQLRPKRAGMVRNALLVGYHERDAAVMEVAKRLVEDPEEAVRETARWVLQNEPAEGR